jgi:hypothetical protein
MSGSTTTTTPTAASKYDDSEYERLLDANDGVKTGNKEIDDSIATYVVKIIEGLKYTNREARDVADLKDWSKQLRKWLLKKHKYLSEKTEDDDGKEQETKKKMKKKRSKPHKTTTPTPAANEDEPDDGKEQDKSDLEFYDTERGMFTGNVRHRHRAPEWLMHAFRKRAGQPCSILELCDKTVHGATRLKLMFAADALVYSGRLHRHTGDGSSVNRGKKRVRYIYHA